ncbi:MAG: hypothetical protein GY850_08000 [bacterium]|nr:hypothetical protein [bacterium]
MVTVNWGEAIKGKTKQRGVGRIQCGEMPWQPGCRWLTEQVRQMQAGVAMSMSPHLA